MRTAYADLFGDRGPVTRCITTNGYIKRNGEAVMGRGVAQQAAKRWPSLPLRLGQKIKRHGNIVQPIPGPWDGYELISFPVKHHWQQPACLTGGKDCPGLGPWPLVGSPQCSGLIVRSANQLVALTERNGWRMVMLPRPGCGNGGLDWTAVEPILRNILDIRFVVVDWPKP